MNTDILDLPRIPKPPNGSVVLAILSTPYISEEVATKIVCQLGYLPQLGTEESAISKKLTAFIFLGIYPKKGIRDRIKELLASDIPLSSIRYWEDIDYYARYFGHKKTEG